MNLTHTLPAFAVKQIKLSADCNTRLTGTSILFEVTGINHAVPDIHDSDPTGEHVAESDTVSAYNGA